MESKTTTETNTGGILADQGRLCTFPIQWPTLWEAYKQQRSCSWEVEEISLTEDLEDWKRLNDSERHFIKYVLAFFAQSDGIVLDNLVKNFTEEVKALEAQYCYTFQANMEQVHAETYALLIDTYIQDANEKQKLFNAIHTMECVKKKADFAKKHMDQKSTFATRLIAFACVEGILFSGSFCAIFWLKERGLMKGLTFSNELISRDEGLHTDFAVRLYALLGDKEKISESGVHAIVRDAVAVEENFIIEAVPCDMVGMNAGLMRRYIHFVADRLVTQLGYKKIWFEDNPFDFIERISMDVKSNFFETKVSAYGKAAVGETSENNSFDLDADF